VSKLSAASDKLISHTCQFWRSRLGRELSREDARQIAENVTGFFSVLYEWSRDECLMPTIDSGAVHPRGDSDNRRNSSTVAVNEVELDAIPAAKLRERVRECIERHVDKQQLAVLRIAEQSEREILSKIAGTLRGSTAPAEKEEAPE
jgi:hypothetical protein